MMEKQHTIQKKVSVSGKGLHTGAKVTLTFKPAPANHGYVFKRTDLPNHPLVHADVDNVVDTSRGTTIAENGVKMHTVEHTLAAAMGLHIDNLLIEVDGPEPPVMDGSSIDFLKILKEAGLEIQDAERKYYVIDKPLSYQEAARGVSLEIQPADNFQAQVTIDFGSEVLTAQKAELAHIEEFKKDFADCRTFCFLHELQALIGAGLIKGGDLDNAVVIVDKPVPQETLDQLSQHFGIPKIEVKQGVLNNGLRYPNEPAKHKLLDVIGDLALLGRPVKGKVVATRPGHKANVELAKLIKKANNKDNTIITKFRKVEKKGIIFDINAIHDILPHRYPFLLVDKIVDFSEKEIVGIKNVTINEPFFQGHFPGNPIMPGVLQLEAMAQVGGILLLNTIENPKTVWVYIAAIDNARFKKPVIPGDTLVLKLELTALRQSICKMKGRAYVDDQLVCSTDMTASIVPKNKQ